MNRDTAKIGSNDTVSELMLPGLIDAHVHLRDPGATHKEDVLTGTTAALAGGVVGVLDMPNNTPPTTTPEALAAKRARFEALAVADYGLFAGYDGDLEALLAMAPAVVGLKLYLDETFGDLLASRDALAIVFEAWPGPGPIAIHGESPSIREALALAARYGQRLHVCHVPHPDDLLVIDRARQAGAAVTCEVTPHHLFLSRDDAAPLGAYGRMKPPLVGPEDVARYWERLDLVDAIATDHAPHTRQEKDSAAPPPGVPGLETMLPLLLHAVEQGRVTIERVIELTHQGPLRVYGLAAPDDSYVVVEIDGPYRLPGEGYRTRCGWSPFAGQWALGRVASVVVRGETVWDHGALLAKPGDGMPFRPTSP